MQLFITDYKVKDQTITIENPEMLEQIRKVLRAKKGDKIAVQDSQINRPTDGQIKRYEIEIIDWDNKNIYGKILQTTDYGLTTKDYCVIAVAMPNKRDKAELIVQKLTEIGIDQILFRPAERSIIKEWNEKKYERLLKISKEAVEQSRGRKMPEIKFVKNLKDELNGKEVIVFDKTDTVTLSEAKSIASYPSLRSGGHGGNSEGHVIIGIVGPEGGLSDKDYKLLEGIKYEVKGLGKTVLRMETAAIVGGWGIKNQI